MYWKRKPVRVANRRPGGLWWRIPLCLVLWTLWAAPIVAGTYAYLFVRGHAQDLPRAPDLERWERTVPRSSVFFSADGALLAEIPFSDGEVQGHRYPTKLKEIPRTLIAAFLAAEDVRFLEHEGVDTRAVLRAALANYRAGRVVEGASTITQQLARNLLPKQLGTERSARRKIREALVAVRLERRYSKHRILESYMNFVFLGSGAYGVKAAARVYFSKSLGELSDAEAAMLAGLAQAPSVSNPFRDERAALARRDEVLARMRKADFLDEARYRAALREELKLKRPPQAYGRLAPWLSEEARLQAKRQYGEQYAQGGLHVEIAASAATAVESEGLASSHTQRLAGDAEAPQVGALFWNLENGYVEAMIGGTDFQRSQFNRATQACRQPGSAFKPIVYGAGLQNRSLTTGTPLRDAPIAVYDDRQGVHWKPRNTGREFRGVALAQIALASSLNAPAIDAFDRVGGRAVIETAKTLGITSELRNLRPLALGSSCVIPSELLGAYASIASGGRSFQPVHIKRARFRGTALVDRRVFSDPYLSPAESIDALAVQAGRADERPQVFEEKSAFLVSQMLRAVVTRGTAAAGTKGLGREAAGKTGTTNGNTDAWFVGFSARYAGAVWLGHDDTQKRLGPRQDGSHAALPLWANLIRLLAQERSAKAVLRPVPAGIVQVRVDRETGLRSRPGAGGAIDLYFVEGTEPTEEVSRVRGVRSDLSRVTREF